MSPTTMILFILMAVFVNVLTYAGIAWIYFSDERRVDPPKPTVHQFPTRSGENRTTQPEQLAS